jgi:hypothetical protein
MGDRSDASVVPGSNVRIMDPSSRQAFIEELRDLGESNDRLTRFRGYALDILVDGACIRRDDEQYDPELTAMSPEEREAFLKDLAEQLAPALSRFVTSWVLLEGDRIGAWRERRRRESACAVQ